MEYLAAVGFFAAVIAAYCMGVHDGRIDERHDQIRRRQWQYRIDTQDRGGK